MHIFYFWENKSLMEIAYYNSKVLKIIPKNKKNRKKNRRNEKMKFEEFLSNFLNKYI